MKSLLKIQTEAKLYSVVCECKIQTEAKLYSFKCNKLKAVIVRWM